MVKSSVNQSYVLDISAASKANNANVQIWENVYAKQQRFIFTYLNNGYYKITSENSGKVLDVDDAGRNGKENVQQFESNGTNAQQWVVKKTDDGYYSIVSRCTNKNLDVTDAVASNGTNVRVFTPNGALAQKFKLEKVLSSTEKISALDSSKYPGFKEKLIALAQKHPNWDFEFLYTTLNFGDAVSGEASNVRRNLVPTSYAGEWINGTETYDTGWYSASSKAIAYYMDPRNFLDEENIFQFLDVNSYPQDSCTLDGINSKISNTFLKDYANEINNACLNKNVNPYYVIARLLQEQGNKGGATWRMTDSDGKVYYNLFNIGASGDGIEQVINNALAKAKEKGWDTVQKGIEGGIDILKDNWLENYQNTLYQNRFDIDKTNGSALYEHQYMQNLMGAYSEAKILKSMYVNTSKLESSFKFIIPLYENMGTEVSPLPSSTVETKVINVKTTGTKVNMRKSSSTDSEIVKTFENAGVVLLSIQRGVNGNWQKVVASDGTVGYISGDLLTQVDDVMPSNYSAYIKTNDGDGCYARYAPTTEEGRIQPAFSENTTVTVIDDSTYKNITGYDWSRCVLSNGTQVFFPSKFLSR